MVVMRRASEADFIFTPNEYDGELRVLKFNGTEAISEPFRYNFRLAAQDSEIDFDTIVGKTACLTIIGEEGDRYVHGMVNKLTQAGTGSRYTIYNLELVPSIWLLTMRYDCRIFQDMNVQDIIN
ncbi:MAG: type secretion system secreted protein VgrG, partial [Candidatus Poribacteria bacterium]|nr:type secretion system secreted protein VgrG [Candidatus Poribacteria bacterium]